MASDTVNSDKFMIIEVMVLELPSARDSKLDRHDPGTKPATFTVSG